MYFIIEDKNIVNQYEELLNKKQSIKGDTMEINILESYNVQKIANNIINKKKFNLAIGGEITSRKGNIIEHYNLTEVSIIG